MKRIITAVLAILILGLSLTGCATKTQEPVSITVWHYYTGALQDIFEEAVVEFNNTVGQEKKIILDVVNVEGIDTLTDNVIAASKEEVGSDSLPDLIFAYGTTVYALDQLGLIADIEPYFTGDELAKYIPAFLEEGVVEPQGRRLGFPVAKSTELVYIENVAYDRFKKAVNASDAFEDVDDSMLSTFEGIMDVADVYYAWTDSQTPDVADDGKAFFGIDAMSNYVSVTARQLTGNPPVAAAGEIPQFALDRESAHTLWDYYMRAIVTGRFAKTGWYRSDDMKTGDLIAYLGSSGGANYFPTSIDTDGQAYDTELLCLTAPVFAGRENFAIQQGAGISVVKSDDSHQKAATEFIKWFTDPEQNVPFAMASGYCPVMKLEYTQDILEAALSQSSGGDVKSQNIKTVLTLATRQMDTYKTFADKGFQGSSDIREMLGGTLLDVSVAARAAFLADLAAGIPYEDAVAKQLGADAFESWYAQIQEEFNRLIAE